MPQWLCLCGPCCPATLQKECSCGGPHSPRPGSTPPPHPLPPAAGGFPPWLSTSDANRSCLQRQTSAYTRQCLDTLTEHLWQAPRRSNRTFSAGRIRFAPEQRTRAIFGTQTLGSPPPPPNTHTAPERRCCSPSNCATAPVTFHLQSATVSSRTFMGTFVSCLGNAEATPIGVR